MLGLARFLPEHTSSGFMSVLMLCAWKVRYTRTRTRTHMDRYIHAHARIYYVHMGIDTIVSISMGRYIHAHARIYYIHMEIDTIVSIRMDRYIHARRAFGRAAC